MPRPALALLLGLALAGCIGEEDPERELPQGSEVRIGIVGPERLVAEGARVETNRINNNGGIGGAATIALVRGTVEQLARRGVRLIVLPCRKGVLRAAHAAERARVLAVAPCDDGVLDAASRFVFTSGLSPAGQAEALRGREASRELPATTARGERVAALLELETGGEVPVSPDAVERVVPPPGAPEGTLFATYGFPDPGNRTDEFYERFRAVYGRRPESIVAALASDAVSVLATAVEEAGSPRPDLAAAELRDGVEVRGAMGTIEFAGGTTRPEVEAFLVQLRDGRLRLAR